MPEIQLSNGTLIRSEHVERAEFYPKDSLAGYGCHFGGPELRDCPFLFVQMRNGAERVNGPDSESDARKLQEAGIKVIRHELAKYDPPL